MASGDRARNAQERLSRALRRNAALLSHRASRLSAALLARRASGLDEDEIWERLYPSINWREPLPVKRAGDEQARLGCRFCIARHGLRWPDPERLYETREEWAQHMAQAHPTTKQESE